MNQKVKYWEPFHRSEEIRKENFKRFGHVMIDLETLGLSANAAIVEIAAVEFNPYTGEVGECFDRTIERDDWNIHGRVIDGDTLAWWFSQGKETIEASFMDQKKVCVSLYSAIGQLIWFIGDCSSSIFHGVSSNRQNELDREGPSIWCNGLSFDIPKLDEEYRHFGRSRKAPWNHWQLNDVRTITNLRPEIKESIEFEGVKHNPVDDCLHQIKLLAATLKALGIQKP